MKVGATTIPEQTSQQFLEDYYCLLDPAGIAARHEENREFDEEWDDMEINWLGHIFVFDRPCFLRAIQNAPEAVRKDSVSIALKHVPDANDNTISRIQLEELYLSGCEEAWAWQYKVLDVDDQEEGFLLPLVKGLRRFIKG